MSRSKDFVLIVDNPRRLLVLFVAVNILVFSGLVQSAIVYEQLPLDGATGPASFYDEQSADDFMLAENTLIGNVVWFGSFTDEDISDNIFDIRFFEDNGGIPGSLISENLSLTATKTSTGLEDIIGEDVFRFSASISSVLLLAGDKYYVSIVHPTNAFDDEFFWLVSSNFGTNFTRNVNAADDSWKVGATAPGDLAFTLGSVPVPPALFMFTPGLLALIGFRKNPKNKV